MMNPRHWFGFLGLLCIVLAAPAQAANVLILDDNHGTEVATDLVVAGHSVTSVIYHDWDGTNPSTTGFDVVLLFEGYEYGHDLNDDPTSPAYAALIQFMQNGGVFASTEWLIYDMDDGYNLPLAPYVPFQYTTYTDYNYSGSYTVLQPGHPLAANLPATWDTIESADGGSCATLKPGAVTVISRSMDYYTQDCMVAFALAYIRVGNGVSIHLNSDLGHEDSEDATPELLQIIRNIVAFQPEDSSEAAVPTLSFWSLILLCGLLGLVGTRQVIGRGKKV